MSQRVSVIAIVVVGSVLACGSDPAPAPATPPANVSVAVTAQATTPAGAAAAPTTATAPAADTSNPDIVTCLGHVDPKATDACKSCVAASCLPQIKTVGTACPEFSKCVCDGTKAMTDCAQYLMTPACGQAGSAVGSCARQSCAAQCPSHTATTATATTAPGGAAPGGMATGGANLCPSLKTCCDQLTAQAQKACSGAVAKNDANACAMTLKALKGAGMCH